MFKNVIGFDILLSIVLLIKRIGSVLIKFIVRIVFIIVISLLGSRLGLFDKKWLQAIDSLRQVNFVIL